MKYTFLVLFSAAIFSCGKDDPKPEAAETKTDVLTKASWKYESAFIDANRDGTTDFPIPPGFFDDCVLDNTVTFAANGTGVVSEGTDVCSGAPATTNISWNFADSEKALVIGNGSIAGVGGQLKIVELSANRLTLSKDTVSLGTNVAVVVSLKH